MVFYFTATGNSLYVAKRIDEYPVSIPQVIRNSSIYSDNQIGIVCPVYCGEILPCLCSRLPSKGGYYKAREKQKRAIQK